MPCIRRRYHFGNVYLAPKPLGGRFSLAGDTVDAVTRPSGFERVSFGGFINADAVPANAQRIQLINIVAFNAEASELGSWIEYGLNAVMLGAYLNGKAWLVLDNERPVSWCAVR